MFYVRFAAILAFVHARHAESKSVNEKVQAPKAEKCRRSAHLALGPTDAAARYRSHGTHDWRIYRGYLRNRK